MLFVHCPVRKFQQDAQNIKGTRDTKIELSNFLKKQTNLHTLAYLWSSRPKMIRQILSENNVDWKKNCKWVKMFCHHCLYLCICLVITKAYTLVVPKTLETRHVLLGPPGRVPSCETAVRNSCYSLIPASLPVFLCLILWHERRWRTRLQQSQQI